MDTLVRKIYLGNNSKRSIYKINEAYASFSFFVYGKELDMFFHHLSALAHGDDPLS